MGFGHRVYKNYDPRAAVLRESAHEVLAELGKADDPLLPIAMELEKIALEDDYFVERKLFPNVDFYSGIILQAMGIPTSMFTAIFAVARTVGWVGAVERDDRGSRSRRSAARASSTPATEPAPVRADRAAPLTRRSAPASREHREGDPPTKTAPAVRANGCATGGTTMRRMLLLIALLPGLLAVGPAAAQVVAPPARRSRPRRAPSSCAISPCCCAIPDSSPGCRRRPRPRPTGDRGARRGRAVDDDDASGDGRQARCHARVPRASWWRRARGCPTSSAAP